MGKISSHLYSGRRKTLLKLAGTAVLLLFIPHLRAQASLPEALEALQQGEFTQALDLLDEIKRQDVTDPLPFLYSAQAMLRDKRPFDAASEIALMSSPERLTAKQQLELGRLLAELDQKQTAAGILRGFEHRADFPVDGLWFLSDLLLELKRFTESLSVLKAYSLRVPEDPRVLVREGQLEILAGNLEAALTTLEKAVQTNPNDAKAYYEMARTLRFGNNRQAASQVIEMAVERNGTDPDYLHLQGIIASELNQFEEAVGYLEKASRLKNAPSRVYFDLGNAYRQLGNREASLQALGRYQELFREEEANKNRAQSVLQLVNQGSQQLQIRDAGAARASYLRALDLDPGNYTARASLIQIYLSSGTLAQAREELESLQTQYPHSAEVSFLSAILSYQEKDLPRSRKEAEASRILRPGNPELRNLLGNIYFAQGEHQAALDEYRAATELAPEHLAYRANYETLARQLGEPIG